MKFNTVMTNLYSLKILLFLSDFFENTVVTNLYRLKIATIEKCSSILIQRIGNSAYKFQIGKVVPELFALSTQAHA